MTTAVKKQRVQAAMTPERRHKVPMTAAMAQGKQRKDNETIACKKTEDMDDTEQDNAEQSSTRTFSDSTSRSSDQNTPMTTKPAPAENDDDDHCGSDYDDDASTTTTNSLFESMGSEDFRKQFREQKTKKFQDVGKGGTTKRGSNDGFDCRICALALCCCLMIGGAIAGVILALVLLPLHPAPVTMPSANASASSKEQAPAPAGVPTVTPSTAISATTDVPTSSPIESTTDPLFPKCSTTIQMPFPDTYTVALYLQVNGDITETDIQYASKVLERSLDSISEGDSSSCDKYCRDVTAATVISSLLLSDASSSLLSQAHTTCHQTLKVVFAIKGTYWGCNDEPFPGIFQKEGNKGNDTNSTTDNIFNRKKVMLRGRRQLQDQDESAVDVCSCIEQGDDDSANLAPTPNQLVEEMEPLLVALPGICSIQSIQG